MHKYLIFISFSAAVLLAWVLLLGTFDILNMNKSPQNGSINEVSGQQQIGGSFTLTGVDGTPVSSESAKGKLMMVYFGFSSCPDICPMDLGKWDRVLDALGEKATEIKSFFISVDPDRDIPEKLKAFAADYPRVTFLTGSKQQIDETAGKFKAFHEVTNEDGKVTVNHSAFIYFMGRDGAYITHFTPDDSADKITARVREELAK